MIEQKQPGLRKNPSTQSEAVISTKASDSKSRPQKNLIPPNKKGPSQQPQKFENEQLSSSPDNKKKKKDDWNYLKQTLKSNNLMNNQDPNQGGDQLDPNLLTFHEKADELVEEQEEFRGKHFEYLKEAAKMLTEEGDLISNVQGFGEEEYDMDEYVHRMEKIITRNL